MNKRFDDFDKEYNRTKIFILIAWFVQVILILAACAFIGWVTVMIMRFFGVV